MGHVGAWGRGLGCLSGGQKRRLAGTPLCPGHQQLLLWVLSQRKPFLGDDKSQLCPRGGVTNCPRRWAELPESEGRPRGAPWGLMASLEGGRTAEQASFSHLGTGTRSCRRDLCTGSQRESWRPLSAEKRWAGLQKGLL